MLGFEKGSEENNLKLFLWKKGREGKEKGRRRRGKEKERKEKKRPQTDSSVSGMNWSISKAGLNFYGLCHFLFPNIPNAISVSFPSRMVQLLWSWAAEGISYPMEIFRGRFFPLTSPVVWPNRDIPKWHCQSKHYRSNRYSFLFMWELKHRNNDTFWTLHLVGFLQ